MDNPSISQVRACLTSGDPWGLTNVTNGGTLYIEPIFGRRIGIWNGSATEVVKVSSLSLSLAGKTAQNYRIYVWDSNADDVIDSVEMVAWTNSTTPPSDTLVADGYLVKTGATERRAVADVMLHATGQCDWRDARRGICHIDERSRRTAVLTAFPSDNSWTVPGSTTTWRALNSGSTIGEHFVEFLLSDTNLVSAEALIFVNRGAGSGTYTYQYGIGLDATNADSATQPFGYDQSVNSAERSGLGLTKFKEHVAVGSHSLNLLEQNLATREAIAYGDNNDPSTFQSGMIVEIML